MTATAGYLDGQLLIAMPGMPDDRFARSVILMCSHSETGAMGLIINRATEEITLAGLLSQLDLADEDEDFEDEDDDGSEPIELPLAPDLADRPVHIGGPVETKRGFVLHSKDYFVEGASVMITPEIALTATVEVLRAIADGTGPKKALLALGYAGWGGGQLEAEIQANSWLHVDTDPAIVFDAPLGQRYEKALARLGVDPSFLVDAAGHA